jgi:hypothetical protein
MTPERFVECLETIDWSIRGFADHIDVSARQAGRWASGRYPIPEPIAQWLEKITQFHAKNPPPPPPEHRRPGPPARDLRDPVAEGLDA